MTTEPVLDLANAALLGTDRRPLPPDTAPDPAGWLLREAARRRAGRLVPGATSAGLRLDDPAPSDDRPLPLAAARAVLDEILLHGSNGLVDLWLRAALDAGVRLAPEHWVPLLDRSRRATDLDRRRLAQALGPRGLWFARHNPAWSLVVRAADAAPTSQPAPDLDDLAALTAATSVSAARALGVRAGAALPLTAYASLAGAVTTAAGPVARVALAAAEEVLWARWDLAHAFDPGRVPPDRQPVRAAATEERP